MKLINKQEVGKVNIPLHNSFDNQVPCTDHCYPINWVPKLFSISAGFGCLLGQISESFVNHNSTHLKSKHKSFPCSLDFGFEELYSYIRV